MLVPYVMMNYTGIFQVLVTAHTVSIKDYVHALISGIEFKFGTEDILVETIANICASCEASRSSDYSDDHFPFDAHAANILGNVQTGRTQHVGVK